MLAYTLKNFLKNLTRFAGNNKYILEMLGEQTGYHYKFTSHKELNVLITIDDKTPEILTTVGDIDFLHFKDTNFKAIKLEETIHRGSAEMYEHNVVNIYYEAQLYIKLFRLMKERVSFMFNYDNKYYYCYYIDGKALYIEETDTQYVIRGTSLFHLNKSFPGYQILSVSEPLNRFSYGKFLDVHDEIAKKKKKELIKYKFESKID